MYRYGILSTASIVGRYVAGIRESRNGEVYGIASRNEETARKAAEQMNIPHWYSSYEACIEDENIDIVYIPTMNAIHYQWAKYALEHHKHVVVEKPFVLKVEEAEAISNYYKKSTFGQSHSLMTALEVEGGMELIPGMHGFQKFMITQGGYTDEPNGKDKFYFGAKKAVDMCTVLTSDLFDDRTIGLMELDWVWWKNSSYIKQWLECYSHDKDTELDDYRAQRFYRPVNLTRY